MIPENLKEIRSRIAAAACRAGRSPEEVTLIAVSKYHSPDEIRQAIAADQRHFGENHAQELLAKLGELTDPELVWHFIGNLQKNKVKYVVGSAALIHSVNSPELAEAIEKEAAKKEGVAEVLLEVNIASESSKQGVDSAGAESLLRHAAALPHLRVKGLMCIAPPVADPEENRPYFRQMRQLLERLTALQLPGVSLTELSMGMSGDFEVAVEEGATLVRVGTAIFGERDYAARGHFR